MEANFTENLDYVEQAGGYTSRGFAQLGQKTAFIGYVGDDYSGRYIHEQFDLDDIATQAFFIDPVGTGCSVNFMYSDGRRKNFYDGKGHRTLSPDLEICKPIMVASKLIYFSIPNWARYLLAIAKDMGATISCDIQDVVTVDDPYRQDFIDFSAILFFSATKWENPIPLMKMFMRKNRKQIVIVGRGEKGCALGHQGVVALFPPVAMEAPVIDTTGAGDGLTVGFLSSYILEGYSLEDSIMRGQIAARHTCTQKVTSSHLVTRKQLEEHFQAIIL